MYLKILWQSSFNNTLRACEHNSNLTKALRINPHCPFYLPTLRRTFMKPPNQSDWESRQDFHGPLVFELTAFQHTFLTVKFPANLILSTSRASLTTAWSPALQKFQTQYIHYKDESKKQFSSWIMTNPNIISLSDGRRMINKQSPKM